MKRARIELRAPTRAERAATDHALLAIVGGRGPVVQHVVRRRSVSACVGATSNESEKPEPAQPRIRRPSKPPWPEPGGVEWAFADARKQRA